MSKRFGPYVCPGVVDCGALMDFVHRDATEAKKKSREEAKRVFEGIKAAHADWLKEHRLSGRALRRAGSPFSESYDDLERWLEETAPQKKPRAKSGFVYVIGLAEDPTAVKIGFAANVDDRLLTLQTSSHRTLKVLATIKGTIAMERKLHRDFADDHIRGEWFRRSEAIESFVARTGSAYLP
ncbi:GIY-YIG nuclease family protein [Bradyrhizobium canariense]|uniref:T5orf172 domain-containing protein n=1 Tax=Bradyrhizobium canariense TaxID=255045 RepID=A0A1H1SIW2_9BRAD|nr:GIY-YIG nuclease family protein [Bradyrhizobium canariense]SDS47917.1 T5orf172 domain-containing protein [Bradyrhizobium canariense]